MKSLFAAQSEIINLKHKLHKQFWYFECCSFVVLKATYSIMKKSQTAPLNFAFKEPDIFFKGILSESSLGSLKVFPTLGAFHSFSV